MRRFSGPATLAQDLRVSRRVIYTRKIPLRTADVRNVRCLSKCIGARFICVLRSLCSTVCVLSFVSMDCTICMMISCVTCIFNARLLPPHQVYMASVSGWATEEASVETVLDYWFSGDVEENYRRKWFPTSGATDSTMVCLRKKSWQYLCNGSA